MVTKRVPKVLVKIWEANGDDNWGKFPIDSAGNVLIKPLGGKGPGDIKETPPYNYKARRKTQGVKFPIPYLGPWRIWKQEYLEYPRGTNKFLERTDKDLVPDVANIERMLEAKALRAYTDEPKQGLIPLATLLVVVGLFFFLVVMPNFR